VKAVRLLVSGRVQGVGYRDWVIMTARRLGLRGWVRNRTDGSVEAVAAGDERAVESLIAACRRGPSIARVDNVDVHPADAAEVPDGFSRRPTA
jgi:acylphosphatase